MTKNMQRQLGHTQGYLAGRFNIVTKEYRSAHYLTAWDAGFEAGRKALLDWRVTEDARVDIMNAFGLTEDQAGELHITQRVV